MGGNPQVPLRFQLQRASARASAHAAEASAHAAKASALRQQLLKEKAESQLKGARRCQRRWKQAVELQRQQMRREARERRSECEQGRYVLKEQRAGPARSEKNHST